MYQCIKHQCVSASASIATHSLYQFHHAASWGRCKSNEFWQVGENGTPWHFWEDKSRSTGVPKKSLCQKHELCGGPSSADPVCPFPVRGDGRSLAGSAAAPTRLADVRKVHPNTLSPKTLNPKP